MKIKNLTNAHVPFTSYLRTVNGERKLTTLIAPNGETHIEEGSTYPDLMRLYEQGVLAINGKTYEQKEHEGKMTDVADSATVPETPEEPETEEVADSTPDTPEVPENASEFTCPHCNAEFASQRGLTMHLKKNHPEVSE